MTKYLYTLLKIAHTHTTNTRSPTNTLQMRLRLDELPSEILLNIIDSLPLFDSLSLLQTCSCFHSLISHRILFISDNDFTPPSPLTDSNYKFIIFKYSATNVTIPLSQYISELAVLPSRIIIVYTNKEAASKSQSINSSKKSNIFDKISTSIFIGDSDLGLFPNLTSRSEPLKLIGHEHYMNNIKLLPQLYIMANEYNYFTIHSRSLESIDGVVNVNNSLPRLPTLYNFLKYSEIPNLRHIKRIGIESGLSLKLFENFPNLQTLYLDSVFTNQVKESIGLTKLNNLIRLEISGNSIILSNIELPNLKNFKFTIHGNEQRDFNSTLQIESFNTPNLACLHIVTSNVPTGVSYLLQHLDLTSLQEIKILSSTLSSFQCLNDFEFPNLKSVTLTSYIVTNENNDYKPSSIHFKAPLLESLDVTNLHKNHIFILGDNVQYPNLKVFKIKLHSLQYHQSYTIDESKFPKLSHLVIEFYNRFGYLEKINIEIEINLSNLVKLEIHHELFKNLKNPQNLRNTQVILFND